MFLAWFLVYILDLPSNVLTLSLKCDSLLPWTDRAMQLTMQMEVQKQLHEQLLDRTLLLNPKTINVNPLRDVAGLRTTLSLKILREIAGFFKFVSII